MKKMLAILLSILMLATAASAVADEAAELVWWGWTPGSPVNESFIEAFNKTYPDIKVTWKQVSIDDYDATIKPALAYGEAWTSLSAPPDPPTAASKCLPARHWT